MGWKKIVEDSCWTKPWVDHSNPLQAFHLFNEITGIKRQQVLSDLPKVAGKVVGNNYFPLHWFQFLRLQSHTIFERFRGFQFCGLLPKTIVSGPKRIILGWGTVASAVENIVWETFNCCVGTWNDLYGPTVATFPQVWPWGGSPTAKNTSVTKLAYSCFSNPL